MKNIQESLKKFSDGNFKDTALDFFKILGYASERRIEEDGSPEAFLDNYDALHRFNRERGLFREW
ncbi:MAG: hypothetical protein BWK79_13750, partial [Beggiatoa sp. IS2]